MSQESQKPENFKFQDNKLVINITASGQEDGETTSCNTQIELHCESEFAEEVLHHLFDQDEYLENLFRKVLAQRSMSKMMQNPGLAEMFASMKDDMGELENESERA